MQKNIAFITDTHLGDKTPGNFGIDARQNLQMVLDAIALQNVNGLVFGGDITESIEFEWFFNLLQNFCPGFKVVLGNHDDYTRAVKYFTQSSAGHDALYYAEEDAAYKYIYLDSSASVIGQEQLDWLKARLLTDKKIVLFVHHPVLGFATGMDAIYPLKNRDAVAALLHGVPNEVYIFCGHYHMNDMQTRGNITQYTTPATSFQVKKASQNIDIYKGPFGYRLITINTQGVTAQLYLYQNGRFEPVDA